MTQSQPQGARAHAQAMINRLTSLLDKLPKQAPAAAQEQSTEPAVNREVLALQREYDLLLSQCAPPQEVLVQLTGAFTETKSLVAVVELGVPDAIGESTLTVPEIAKKVGADARKLGQVMRQLANRAVFDEVGGKGSGHFACNRVSRLLLSSHPQSLAPFVGQWGNDTYDAARWQVDSLRSKDAGSSAFQLGNGGKSFFAWLHEPAQKSTAEKVNASQLSFNYFLQQGIIEDFDWAGLGQTKLIDVGGGVGPMEMELVQRFPSLSFQIQDLVAVVEDGEKRWRASDSLRPFIESGQVGFQAQDFFSPQSRKLENENFMIKQCLHNWTDEDAVRILKNLRAGFGAGAKGKLYAVEFVLTPSSGRAAHMIDINILTLVSSIQRTEAQFEGLFASAGWKLERTVETRSGIAVMVASPV